MAKKNNSIMAVAAAMAKAAKKAAQGTKKKEKKNNRKNNNRNSGKGKSAKTTKTTQKSTVKGNASYINTVKYGGGKQNTTTKQKGSKSHVTTMAKAAYQKQEKANQPKGYTKPATPAAKNTAETSQSDSTPFKKNVFTGETVKYDTKANKKLTEKGGYASPKSVALQAEKDSHTTKMGKKTVDPKLAASVADDEYKRIRDNHPDMNEGEIWRFLSTLDTYGNAFGKEVKKRQKEYNQRIGAIEQEKSAVLNQIIGRHGGNDVSQAGKSLAKKALGKEDGLENGLQEAASLFAQGALSKEELAAIAAVNDKLARYTQKGDSGLTEDEIFSRTASENGLSVVGYDVQKHGETIGKNEQIAEKVAQEYWDAFLEANSGDVLQTIKFVDDNLLGVQSSKLVDKIKDIAETAKDELVKENLAAAQAETRANILSGENIDPRQQYTNAPATAANDLNRAYNLMDATVATTNKFKSATNSGVQGFMSVYAGLLRSLDEALGKKDGAGANAVRLTDEMAVANRASAATKAGKVGSDILSQVGMQIGMIPLMGAGMAAGGALEAWKGAGALAKIGQALVTGSGYGVMAGGQELQHAYDAGATKEEARKSAAFSAAAETLLGSLTEVRFLNKFFKTPKEGANSIKAVLKSTLGEMLRSAGLEGATEVLTAVSQRAAARAIYGHEDKDLSTIVGEELMNKDNWYAGGLGALMGGAMGSVSGLGNGINSALEADAAQANIRRQLDDLSGALQNGATESTAAVIQQATEGVKNIQQQATEIANATRKYNRNELKSAAKNPELMEDVARQTGLDFEGMNTHEKVRELETWLNMKDKENKADAEYRRQTEEKRAAAKEAEHAEVLKSQLEEQQNVQEVENVQADIRNKQKWTLREALDTAIAGGKLSPKQLNNIARNQQARAEFEAATGIKLEGLSNKKAVQAIQEHIDSRSKNATNADIESQMRKNIDSRIADSKAKAKAALQIENNVVKNGDRVYNDSNQNENVVIGGKKHGQQYQQQTQNDKGRSTETSDGVGNAGESGGERRVHQGNTPDNGTYKGKQSELDGRGNNRVVSGVRRPINHKEPQRIIADVRRETKHGACVDEPTPADYANGKVIGFVSEDGEATISVRNDGDIVAFGKTKDCKTRGAAKSLMYTALQNGGTKLDCYGENLAKYYQENYGMVPVAKVKYDPNEASDAIKAYVRDVRGGEGIDVYVMAHNGDDINTIQSTAENGGYELTDLDSLPVMEYDKALAYRDGLIDKGNNYDAVPLARNDKSNKDVAPSKFPQHVQESPDVSREIKDRVAADEEIQTHEVLHNKDIVAEAKRRVESGEWSSDKFAALDAKQATAEDVAIGLELFSKYQNEGNYDAAYNCVEKLDEIGRRGGQIVQAYTLLRRFTPDGIAYYAQKELNKVYGSMSERMQKKYGEQMKLSEDDINYIKTTMAEALELPNGSREQQVKFGLIQKRITDKIPASTARSLRAFTRINMLANFKTTITRNIGSNAAAAAVNTAITDPVAVLFDKLVAKKTGVRTTTVGTGGYGKSTVQGIKESVEDYKLGINTRDKDANRYNEDLSDYGKDWFIGQAKSFNETGKFAKVGKALNKVDGLVSFALDAGDRMFYTAEFNKSLQSQMKANNVKEPTVDMVETAKWVALKRTWQDNNAITRTVSKVVSALNGGKEFGIGSILAPFVKTPVNLAIATIEYSPAGLVKTLAIDARNLQRAIKRGEGVALAQKKFVDGFGKAGAGVIFSLIGKALWEAGIISGAEDDDWDKANFMKNSMGIQPYSIKIGDKSFTYSWALPLGGNFGITADTMERLKNAKETGDYTTNAARLLLDVLTTTVDVSGSFLAQQTFMQSLVDAVSSFDENNVMGAVENVAKSMATQFIPFSSLMGQVAGIFDDVSRRTSGKDVENVGDNETMQYILNSILARTPFASKKLQPVLDSFGREQERFATDNVLAKALLSLLSPTNVKKEKAGIVENGLLDLYNQTGDASVFPSILKRDIQYGDKEFSLTGKEYTVYQKTYGQTAYNVLDKVMNSDDYKNADDNTKAKMVSMCYDYADQISKKKALSGKANYDLDSWVKTALNPDNETPIDKAIIWRSQKDVVDENKQANEDKESPDQNKELLQLKEIKSHGWDIGTYYNASGEFKNFNAKNDSGKTEKGLKKKRQAAWLRNADMPEDMKDYLWGTTNYKGNWRTIR